MLLPTTSHYNPELSGGAIAAEGSVVPLPNNHVQPVTHQFVATVNEGSDMMDLQLLIDEMRTNFLTYFKRKNI